MDMTKYKVGKVHFRNSRVGGLNILEAEFSNNKLEYKITSSSAFSEKRH